MNVRNCKKCGKMFNYAVGPIICPQCREAQEAKFQEVKKYIQEHPRCGIPQVSEECDVEVGQIQQWLREERLEFGSESMVVLQCENCGAQIYTGRFCEKCKNSMANSLNAAFKPAAPKAEPKKDLKENPRMRFLDK